MKTENTRQRAMREWSAKRKRLVHKDVGIVIQWGEQKSLLLSEISWIDEPFISINKDLGEVKYIVEIHLKNNTIFTQDYYVEPKSKTKTVKKKWFQLWKTKEYEVTTPYDTQDYFNDEEHIKYHIEQYNVLQKFFKSFNNK